MARFRQFPRIATVFPIIVSSLSQGWQQPTNPNPTPRPSYAACQSASGSFMPESPIPMPTGWKPSASQPTIVRQWQYKSLHEVYPFIVQALTATGWEQQYPHRAKFPTLATFVQSGNFPALPGTPAPVYGWEQPTSQPVQVKPPPNFGVTVLPEPFITPAALVYGWEQPFPEAYPSAKFPNVATGEVLPNPALKYGWEQPTDQPPLGLKFHASQQQANFFSPPALRYGWEQPTSQPVLRPQVPNVATGIILPGPKLIYGWEQPVSQPGLIRRADFQNPPFSLPFITPAEVPVTGWEQPTSQPVLIKQPLNTSTGTVLPFPKIVNKTGWEQPTNQPPIGRPVPNLATGTILTPPALRYGWEQPPSEPFPSAKVPALSTGTFLPGPALIHGWEQAFSQPVYPISRQSAIFTSGTILPQPSLIYGWEQPVNQPPWGRPVPTLSTGTFHPFPYIVPVFFDTGWEQPTNEPYPYLRYPNLATGIVIPLIPTTYASGWEQPPSEPYPMPPGMKWYHSLAASGNTFSITPPWYGAPCPKAKGVGEYKVKLGWEG